MKLAAIADKVARDIYTRPIHPDIPGDTVIRSACDLATGGDLSYSMLNRLCDMVHARLHSDRFWTWRAAVSATEHGWRKGAKR